MHQLKIIGFLDTNIKEFMMKKINVIKIVIGILIICLIIVFIFIANLLMLNDNKNEQNVENNKNLAENNSSENYIDNTNQIDLSNDANDYIFYNEDETGEAEYDIEQANKIQLEFEGITEEILTHITDMDNFKLKIKEYVYLEGLVDATVAKVEQYEYQESTSRFGIIFDLNNPSSDKLLVILNANGSVEISKK